MPKTTSEVAVYRLPAADPRKIAAKRVALPTGDQGLPLSVLMGNVCWFCRLRWLVATALLAMAAMGWAAPIFQPYGLALRWDWPLAAALVLIVFNLAFVTASKAKPNSGFHLSGKISLWAQIVVDLAVLTVVVHYLGSLETFAPFAYLCHIVLACIFFPRRQSFVVTALATLFYLTCIALESLGVIAPQSIFTDSQMATRSATASSVIIMQLGIVIFIWLAVWYLTAHLGSRVRQRDRELAATNSRLISANRERVRHMLRTTHELKAPFAAICAQTQLLQRGYCGELTEKARKVIAKIDARCRFLSDEIKEMLQLANLQSEAQESPAQEDIDIAKVIAAAIDQVEPAAQTRRITIDSKLEPVEIVAVRDQMQMLFGNLITNAVNYSHDGGTVRIRCSNNSPRGAEISIADEGIGIPPQKLPHIFDDYYRTEEAVRHNRASTGLGLAIVRHIAQAAGWNIEVASKPGKGTTFTVKIPSVAPKAARQELAHAGG